MDIGLLKAFLEIHRLRHFGRAAKNLFISQSAISARLRQLEDELGARLFTRERNNIELTAAGQKFLQYAENMLNSWNRARQEIAIAESSTTLLSIAAQASVWDIYLEDWLKEFYQQHRDIALQTHVMSSDSISRNLLDGVLDLGFMLEPPETAELVVSRVFPVPLIMVSTEKSIGANTAVQKDYVFVDWGTSFRMRHAQQFPDAAPPVLRANVGRLALSFLNNCGGSAYLPEAMVADQLGHSLFKVEDAAVIDKAAYAVYSPTNGKRELLEAALK